MFIFGSEVGIIFDEPRFTSCRDMTFSYSFLWGKATIIRFYGK